MALASPAGFRVSHALRIKGLATVETLTEMTGLERSRVEASLRARQQEGLAVFRDLRRLWQLSPAGRHAHATLLRREQADGTAAAELRQQYLPFVGLDRTFKELCAAWQLRDGDPNDHRDASYDRRVIGRLREVNAQVQPLCRRCAHVVDRFARYGPRLDEAARRVHDGDGQRFTGVLCHSFHDIWMELHEDLMLTLGIDRLKEASC